jgi:hypothetical protein
MVKDIWLSRRGEYVSRNWLLSDGTAKVVGVCISTEKRVQFIECSILIQFTHALLFSQLTNVQPWRLPSRHGAFQEVTMAPPVGARHDDERRRVIAARCGTAFLQISTFADAPRRPYAQYECRGTGDTLW